MYFMGAYAPLAKAVDNESQVNLIVDSLCGNTVVDPGEQCDDGNLIDGDGCSSACQIESSPPSTLGSLTLLPEIFNDLYINNIFVRKESYDASINWQTNKEAWCQLSWGENQGLTSGVNKEIDKKIDHRVFLSGLMPNSNYYYQINCQDNWGHQAESDTLNFYTEPIADMVSPANVTELSVEFIEGVVKIKWKNPSDNDLQGIRIRRSEEFYPSSINDGIEIYNDKGEQAIDQQTFPGKTYYYTVFTYDSSGNYSSGAIIAIKIPSKYTLPNEITNPSGPTQMPQQIVILPKPQKNYPQSSFQIDWNDLSIMGANGTIKLELNSDQIVSVLPGLKADISYPEDKAPKHLKSIIFSIYDSSQSDKVYSYLLKINQKKYDASLTLPVKKGNYILTLSLIDYYYQQVTSVKGQLQVKEFGQLRFINNKNKTENLVKARVTLFQVSENKFTKWPGYQYSQFNPLLSNPIGQYGFLVPNGSYQLRVEKNGFIQYNSVPFSIKDNVINRNIDMVEIPEINWLAYLTLLLILVGLLGIIKIKIKKKSK